LIHQRNALQGIHIETAYDTPNAGHPIRKVIVESLARAYFSFQQDPLAKKVPVYKRGEGDAARRNAFGGHQFIFQDQLDNIAEFKNELNEEAMMIMQNRTQIFSRSGKTSRTSYTDPLSGENFTL
jgi:hypothetical protein